MIFSQHGPPTRWMRWSLLNFLIAAGAGALTRYKISFSLPQLGFDNLVHAHSHFAFAAWATSGLAAVLIAGFVPRALQEARAFKWLFIGNQLTSYGMLITFLIQGYGPASIIASTLSLFISYGYAWYIWKHAGYKNLPSYWCLRFALICLVVSSAGPYALAYMEATHHANLITMNNAVYWYLHFQYNGWFLFAVFAAALRIAENKLQLDNSKPLRLFSIIMIASCFPLYFVSLLWMAPGKSIFIFAGIASAVQLIAGFFLARVVFSLRDRLRGLVKKTEGKLLAIAMFSLFIKLVLQFGCVFPFLNKFVFGYRPVIIGYLHLIFLGIVTCYLLAMSISDHVINLSRRQNAIGVIVFVTGFLLTEMALLTQGLSVVIYFSIPLLPTILFCAALIMVTGIALLVIGNSRKNALEH